jgi:hypothetical protein
MARRKDFVEEIVDERTAANTEFPALVEAALRRRESLRSAEDVFNPVVEHWGE